MSSTDFDPQLLAEFIDESEEALAGLDSLLVQLESDPSNLDLVNRIFRPVHSLKGNSAFFGLLSVKKLAHTAENLLDAIRQKKTTPDASAIGCLLPALDLLRQMLHMVRQGGDDTGFAESMATTLQQIEHRLANGPQEVVTQAPLATASQPLEQTQQSETDRTMRVSEHSIDSFLEYVGELVVVEEVFTWLFRELNLHDMDGAIRKRYKDNLETFTRLSGSLRKSILDIRKVAGKQLLQKAPRMVRDAMTRTGKSVRLVVEGEDLKLDKSYLDLLDAPLTHIVNNALDHGIEQPKERLLSGKPETGTLHISLRETEQWLVLAISDDGKGIDRKAVLRKATSLGLTKGDENLDDQALLELLLAPGLSTASKVTDVSGRGVGMDVVHRNINSAGGKISLRTEDGKGSTFTIELPRSVNTQIIEGFVIEVANLCYVLPVEWIRDSRAVADVQIQSAAGKGLMVMHHGKMSPLMHLGNRLEKIPDQIPQHGILLTTKIKGQEWSVLVDNILGIQKIVIKQLDGLNHDLFDGAAMMGDGRLAMILGQKGLTTLAELR